MTGLELDNLQIWHNDTLVVGLTASVAPGEALTVMGPSGVGKSTILAAITGTLPPNFTQVGTIRLDGKTLNGLPPQDRHTGILMQEELLFPHMSVAANLAFGLPAAIKGKAARMERICAALSEIDLDGFEHRDPATLSGGQKARVALMRVLLSEPRVLLLDEPFSRLDAALRDQMRSLVFDRAHALGLPVLLVTHDQADADAAGGEVVTLA
ncbi:ATP-binding cassette domain-containing protein [Actibacterium pelagium]|uniref:ABC transporter ATP-binding protein n=1 Tax=Actibacterium pelagium TaxID=2029103 RepID=A0A917ACS0_9RHOB|nr:ATP-binding cassette domain-containing protein [Actibacterium pelagium]GGE38749.1 ABC transporter ATP-binding protein [Actibacterium pelagium]